MLRNMLPSGVSTMALRACDWQYEGRPVSPLSYNSDPLYSGLWIRIWSPIIPDPET